MPPIPGTIEYVKDMFVPPPNQDDQVTLDVVPEKYTPNPNIWEILLRSIPTAVNGFDEFKNDFFQTTSRQQQMSAFAYLFAIYQVDLGIFKAKLNAQELEMVRLRKQIQSLEDKLENEAKINPDFEI